MDNTYAGIWLRSFAKYLDWMFIDLVFFGVIYLLSFNVDSISSVLSGVFYLVGILLLSTLIIWTYNSWTTYKFGGTPGKLLLGLNVVDANNQPLSFKQSVLRHTIGYALSALLFGLGFYWITRDKNRQGFHDMAMDTYVIRKSQDSFRYILAFCLFVLIFIVAVFLIRSTVSNVMKAETLRDEINQISIDLSQRAAERMTIPETNFEYDDNDESFPGFIPREFEDGGPIYR